MFVAALRAGSLPSHRSHRSLRAFGELLEDATSRLEELSHVPFQN